MTTPKSQKVELSKSKDTKNTVRFDADADDAATSNVYLTKAAAEALGNPEKITVEIKAT